MLKRSAWLDIDWSTHRRTVKIGAGQEVNYVEYGRGRGPAVLLIHGLGGSWQAWLENIPDLGRSHRVIALDLPGFGATKSFVGALTPGDYSRVVSRFCDAIGLESVIVVGNSFGGWVSAELAIHRPELVAGLVLVDAAGIPPTRRERVKVVTLLRLTNRAAPLGVKYRELVIHNQLVRRRALSFMFAHPSKLSPEIVNELLPATPSPVFGTVLLGAVSCWSESFTASVQELDVPALVIWGELDAQLPLRHGQEWARLLKNSRLVTIPGAGHLPMIEEPEHFAAAIEPFLALVKNSLVRDSRTPRRTRAAHPA